MSDRTALEFSRVGQPFWDDKPVAIVGTGPSLTGFDFHRILDCSCHVLAVNNSVFDLLNADAVFSLDFRWIANNASRLRALARKMQVYLSVTEPTIPGAIHLQYQHTRVGGFGVWNRVVKLPQGMMSTATSQRSSAPLRAAVTAQIAVAIAILTVAPVRLANLVAIKLGIHRASAANAGKGPASTTRVCRQEHRVRLYYDWVVTVATIARHRSVPVSWSALDRS